MASLDVSTPKGMRDIEPEEMKERERIFETIKGVFRVYGFVPLETPALENWEVLSAKGAGGEEILNETYNFEDKGGRRVGLRYDLTVPLARFVANNPNIPLPFKRYQIGRVWRYGDVAKGRLREFWQADSDIVGSESMLADAEVIACAVDVFKSLGFEKFAVRVNNRKILSAMVQFAGVEKERVWDVLRVIDKLEKVGERKVAEELSQRGVNREACKKLMELLMLKGDSEQLLEKADGLIGVLKEGKDGVRELRELLSYLKSMGCSEWVRVDFSLARGLEYYTGPIFEVSLSKEIGSVAGGGRYDRMIGLFLGREMPATGISFGIDRIAEVIQPKKSEERSVFVAYTEGCLKQAVEFAAELRRSGIPAVVDLRGRSLAKQLSYANSIKVSYAVIVGREELKQGKVKLRDFKSGEERVVSREECIGLITSK
ncbi:MAG: histidine--tRNA ligase [Candidatus Micrarchaeia archaeon]